MYITGINLPDNEENKYNLPTSSIEDTKVLKLPYNASTFTLSYVALSYTSPDAIRYAYKLEGADKDWNYMDQNKNVTFANLSPGEYTFKVTVSSGIMSERSIVTNHYHASLLGYRMGIFCLYRDYLYLHSPLLQL